MDLAPADIARVRELYSQGFYRRAHDVAASVGPLREWSGTAARLIGGRLAIQLGAACLGRRMHLLAFRATPAHPEAIYYHARYRMERFGPLSTWAFMRQHPDWSSASPELQADWISLNGFIAARLRDFDRAERWLNKAEAAAPDRPWPCIERSSVYELADRPEDALVSARRSLELHPWFRPGVQSVAHLLCRLGRDREALEFLTDAESRLESGLVSAQLAALQNDLGHHADALRTLDRYAEFTPLREADNEKWLSARRADTLYFLGDFAPAADHARAVKDDFYDRFAARLSEANRDRQGAGGTSTLAEGESSHPLPDGRGSPRVVLPLDLAGTPAPTVYDLLARFWSRPLPNPAPDSPPPLDGLPDAAERNRAEQAGWACREFTLSPGAASELIGRGVPFVVTLVEAGFSQPRLCVGTDTVRGSVLLADGFERRPIEAPAAGLVERFAPFGPRCLALVPTEHAAKLDDLPALSDCAEREALYAVQKPLLAHDRAAAVAALDRIREAFPDHRLTPFAELALARYDAHPVKLLRAYDKLLAAHPHEATWVLAKAGVLRELNRMPERVALLEAEGESLSADPLIMQSLAQAILPLPHRQQEAAWLLRRSVRNRPSAAAGYYLLATQWWEHRRFDEAAELYRFAATLDDREDQFAEAYFRAARATDQVPAALGLFQQKSVRAAVPAPAATRALYHALADRDEPEQARAALDQAIRKLQESVAKAPVGDASEKRPEHAALGDLLMFRAECHASAGRVAEADADLVAAKPLVPAAAWHRASGRVNRAKPDVASAGAHFLEVVKLDPLSPDSHRTLTALLAATDGRAAARTHLAQACAKFPHHHPLLKLRAEFLSGDTEADADRAILDMLDECPDDAWALRQRALVLADRKRLDEAFADVERAGKLEPDHPWYYAVLAQVQKRADKTDEALESIRRSLRTNVDQEPMIAELVQTSRGRGEKRAAISFLTDELRRQPHTGEGLVAFVDQARQVYTDPDDHGELLHTLEEILDDRPDLWQAWSVVIQQMAGLMRLEEANELARDATDRFPLLAKLWLDRAQVCHAMGDAERRLDALRQAVAVAPGWSIAARELADALDEAEERTDAVLVLERAAAKSPLDPFAHAFLAERLWEAGRSREALDRAKAAVRHEPGYDRAWHQVQMWAERLEVPDEPAELVRELSRDRAGDPRVWLRLARMLHHPRHNDEVLAALEKATTLDPKNVEAHDLKAERLAEMGRYDEALAAAQPPELAADVAGLPFVLQGRLAWIEARRGNFSVATDSMRALVEVDPTYLWGWHQLAEWYNETGRPENYLEAANALVKLQPGHPVALMMRGEAKLQTGDRAGGKADLRDTLKVSPGYSHAAAVLFDACLEDDEIRDARQALAVLQEHAAGPEVAVKQIQLAVRTDDADGAVRAFAEVCEGPGQSPFPVQSALTELKDAGWGERAARVMREAWQGGGPFQPWVPIFWVDSSDGRDAEPGDRVRAADACIKAYPKFMPGHDCKAEQLALAGRFEEALAACKPAELDPLPVELRGRAAWVENRRGDRGRALTLMRQIVAEHPDFVLGWRQLAAWYDAAGRFRECLEACEQFVKFEPANPLAYVYRGEARRSLADRRGALADFQRALELDPTFEAAGLSLVTEQLATGDVPGAARTLTAVSEHSDGPLVRLRGVQVECRRGDYEAALARFRPLAQDLDTSRGMLKDALMAFDAEGWGPRVTDELKELAFAPDGLPELAGLWAERAVAAGAAEAVSDKLPDLLAANPSAGREAALAYIWALADGGKPVQGAVTKYSEVLRADATAWARAGAALVAGGNLAHAAAWLADWRDRDGVEPWMLRALAIAYRGLDQDDKAVEVCRAAVRLGGPDEALADFRAWLSLDLALSGQTDEAAAVIARVDTVSVPDGTRLVLAMAEAVLMVSRSGPAGKTAALAEAKDHLRSAAAMFPGRGYPAGAGRAYRRVVKRLAADAGTLSAKLWGCWQRLFPWVK